MLMVNNKPEAEQENELQFNGSFGACAKEAAKENLILVMVKERRHVTLINMPFHGFMHFNWVVSIPRLQDLRNGVVEPLTLCNIGPMIWSCDEGFYHNSFMKVIFCLQKPKIIKCIPGLKQVN